MGDADFIRDLIEECKRDLSDLNEVIKREEERGKAKATSKENIKHGIRYKILMNEKGDLQNRLLALKEKLKNKKI